MPSPFPGMDPYLESPGIWPGLHNDLAVRIQAVLNQRLPERYYAKLDARAEVGVVADDAPPPVRAMLPDVAVLRGPATLPSPTTTSPRRRAGAVLEPALEPQPGSSRSYDVVARDEALTHLSVEVRDARQGHQLVTLIELVSPSNKHAGRDRQAYLRNQRDVLRSNANSVEIDLLRAGRRLFAAAELHELVDQIAPPKDYLVLVSRYWRRLGSGIGYQILPFGVRDRLPRIDVPLREHEDEVPLDLQGAFDAAYDAGPYRRGAVDYQLPPSPPLREPDAAWADQLLRGAGLRGAA